MIFEWCMEENLMVNNKVGGVFITRNHWSDSCPLEIDVVKTSIFTLKASLLWL